MRSDVVIVASRDRRPRIECRGGIAGRETSDGTVHLVSSAATPLGGDAIAMRVVVESGARLRLRTAAAMMALPSAKERTSHSRWTLDCAGVLDIDMEPTIVAADARHMTELRIAIADSGLLRIRERVQIGRSGERDGFWSGLLHADIERRPLLRHRVELGAGSVADDALTTPRAMVSELRYPKGAFAGTAEAVGTPLALAAGGVLTTWQGGRL
ncbi:MAG: urease accessory protein UreD [Mycobacterium sp.]